MDPHQRIYSGTGSYGMSQNRFQSSQGRFSSSPTSSTQCNFPYSVMLPQQQQKLNPVVTPSSSSFGYSQLPQTYGQFSRKGQNQRPGMNVNYVQLNWNDLLGSNQNSVGTSGTSQVILGGNDKTSATSQGQYYGYNGRKQQFTNNTQGQNYQQVNTENLQPQGQQYYQPQMQSYPSSQVMYNNTPGQPCGNPGCQNCGESQSESPIKFKVSVGNQGDGLGLGTPTYEYTFPTQSSQQQDASYSSGDNTKVFADQTESVGNPNDNAPASVASEGDTATPSSTNQEISKESTPLQTNIRDPCGNCNACKYKPVRKLMPITVSKNNANPSSIPSPCPIPKLTYKMKQMPPTVSVVTRLQPNTRKSSNAVIPAPLRAQSAVKKPTHSNSSITKK